jgi:predicted RNA-binding protein with PIN domain
VHFIVDGMNVIGTRPDGWWRDRRAARRRLVQELAPLSGRGDTVTVVFDGRRSAGEANLGADVGVRSAFAPGGPNAADDAIVDLVGTLASPADVTVVTSDGGLAARVRLLGTKVEGANTFRSRLSVYVDGVRRSARADPRQTGPD